MKKIILMVSSVAFLLLCAVAMDASAQSQNSERVDQGQRDRVLSPVTVEEVNIGPLTEKEKRQIKKKVLQKLEIPGMGDSIGNPILPYRWTSITAGGRRYYINVTITSLAVTIWVELPKGIGDNQYDLWVYQNDKYVDSGVDIEGGVLYQFNEPVSNFSIRGIEPSAQLDPANETAFPTGLRFEKTGKAVVTMTTVTKEN